MKCFFKSRFKHLLIKYCVLSKFDGNPRPAFEIKTTMERIIGTPTRFDSNKFVNKNFARCGRNNKAITCDCLLTSDVNYWFMLHVELDEVVMTNSLLQGNYAKFLKNLHTEQLAKLLLKNQHECDLLEDIRTFTVKRSAIEKSYSDVSITTIWCIIIIMIGLLVN